MSGNIEKLNKITRAIRIILFLIVINIGVLATLVILEIFEIWEFPVPRLGNAVGGLFVATLSLLVTGLIYDLYQRRNIKKQSQDENFS